MKLQSLHVTQETVSTAQLSRIAAIVWLSYSIRQLQLSESTFQWENQFIGRSMSYHSTIDGAVPISTSGNRASSGWPLYVTSNNELPRHSIKYKEWDEATSLYITYMVYMIITQTRCTMAFLLAVILEESSPLRRPISCLLPREEHKIRIQSDRTYTCKSNATINWIS